MRGVWKAEGLQGGYPWRAQKSTVYILSRGESEVWKVVGTASPTNDVVDATHLRRGMPSG